MLRLLSILAVLALLGCSASDGLQEANAQDGPVGRLRRVRIASLESGEGLAELRADFEGDHPGFRIRNRAELTGHLADERPCVVFIQTGEGQGSVGRETSQLRVGDIVLLRVGEELTCEGPLGGVLFEYPEDFPRDLPTFVRVDFDPSITDTPGGCATDPGAYRRVALTWLASRGPYILHGFNAHRVRIEDSFTHVHPMEGGFDEFYLVQEAPPGARLLTSARLARITDPAAEDPGELDQLLTEHPLEAGDLVYIPRGIAHRGLGGAVVHVLAVPGFRPGGEIGLDHVLHELNEAHGLTGEAALPLHESGALEAVVK